MSIPVWVLLAFAAWTVLVLFVTVGIYRWRRILTGRATVREWRADEAQGNSRYQRAMRAHMNCVENLPVYGAIVVAMLATGVTSPVLDVLALVLLGARVLQTTVHVVFEQTEPIATLRFTFYAVQMASMIWMGLYVALSA